MQYVDCRNLLKEGLKCPYSKSMFCPLNVAPGLKEGINCVYALSKTRTGLRTAYNSSERKLEAQ